uniref:zinc finger protein 708-like n=1 Tax=Monopterus albus TaxID=43700 RepID=UPI0009B2E8B1|nr:zinc finger protein 708-like [Monopterus albus]
MEFACTLFEGLEDTCPPREAAEDDEMDGVKVEAEQTEEVQGEGTVPDMETPSTTEEPALKQKSRQSKCRHCCSVCGREFSRPSRLADHMFMHSGDKPYSCSVCGKRFTKKINMTVHQRVHTGEKPYSCPDCGVSYAQLGCLRRHRLQHAAEKPHHCSVCGRGFIQRRYLIQHERTHTGERPFSCSLCPKRFASRSGLTDHQKTHKEENLYSCSICEKVFSTPSSFRDHVRLHTGQKPHPCSLCCKSFNRPGLLRKHLEKHAEEQHVVKTEDAGNGQEETPHACPLCHKCFSTAEKLQQHSQLHQRALRFVCDICGRGFTRASRLREHTRSHTGERPFQCDVCKKRFSVQGVLRKHREIHRRGKHSLTMTPDDDSAQEADCNTSLGSDGVNRLQELRVEYKSTNEGEEVGHSLPDRGPTGLKKLLICSVCGQSYPSRSRLREHCKIHTTEKQRNCSVCGKTFTSASGLRAHQKVHLADRPHPCSICPKSFLKPCLLRKHMRTHIRDGLLATPADKEFWLNEKTLDDKGEEVVVKREEEEGLDEQDSQDLPTSTLKPRPLPDNHGKRERNEGDVSGLINSDGEEEDWRPALIAPVRDAGGGSQLSADSGGDGKSKHCCPVCGRDCFKASALQKHLRIHSGERPFQCPTCRKSFTQQVHMTEHQRIHTGEKPYTCTDCGKSFTFSRPALTHSGVRFRCPLCSKSFSRALELTYHVDTHSDAQPYFCSICKKNLSGARIFRNHMKKHETANSPLPRAGPQEAETPSECP